MIWVNTADELHEAEKKTLQFQCADVDTFFRLAFRGLKEKVGTAHKQARKNTSKDVKSLSLVIVALNWAGRTQQGRKLRSRRSRRVRTASVVVADSGGLSHLALTEIQCEESRQTNQRVYFMH